MAFSKIVITFTNWDVGDPTGSQVNFQVDGIPKNETAVAVRISSGQFNLGTGNFSSASNFAAAWLADYAGSMFTVNIAGNVVTIEATYDGATFTPSGGYDAMRIAFSVTNVAAPDPVFELTGAALSAASSSPCTNIKVTLTETDGVAPFEWISPLTGLAGLIGDVPRSGTTITITIEDDDAEQDTIDIYIPAALTNAAISAIQITGDPSGLFGTVAVFMTAITGLTYEYSMDGVTFQTSNAFTSVLPGSYTMYIRDQYGCTISQAFDVTLTTIRPPVYREMPRSNSFGWYERQADVAVCSNPYKGINVKPNSYKPLRWTNPPYYQPWCLTDSPITQFRSNYDTITAKLFNLADDDATATPVKTMDIVQHSNNLGQRQIMDAKIYDRGSGQTGVYWLTGDIYDTDGTTVIGSFDLEGQLPEWVKVGQKFSLSGSAVDGLFEIKQIIFDSELLVNAAVIDRVYTDMSDPVDVKVDAVYNKLNYETYEFTTVFEDVPLGCYKVILAMTDSLAEYPDVTFESLPISLSSFTDDLVLIESSDHVDDGILYSTGITHKQRFTGVFYEEEYSGNFETHSDSRRNVTKLDGRVQKIFVLEAIDVPYWVYEKLSLYIAKNLINVNTLEVQFVEAFEVERNRTYSRVNIKAEAIVSNYEQYVTNTYDIL